MSKSKKTSAMDLLKKFTRHVRGNEPDHMVWATLESMVNGLTESMLPTDALAAAVAARDIGAISEIRDALDPQKYVSPAMLLQDRAVVEMFKKYVFANSPFNKREKAQIRFLEAEASCRAANHRIRSVPPTGATNWVVSHAIREIERILGTFNVGKLLDGARFGPGSTLCVRGKATSRYFKLRCTNPSVSIAAFPYAEALLNYDKKWVAHLCGIHPFDVAGRFNLLGDGPELQITNYNKVAFVPKNAKTDRSIAIEPYFNLYFQLGVGAMLRHRLHKGFGIVLDSQKRNQNLAYHGSISGHFATVDHSMASDTVSVECVRLLLPPEWYAHLNRLRTDAYIMDRQGKPEPYHKFSSMGNGFTFELETLIFAALARGAHAYHGLDPSHVSVFGDDVILSPVAFSLYEEVTTYLGFKINAEKSFVEGPFRESCGEDFFEGSRVRPVFCEELRTVQHVISLTNRLSTLNRAVVFGDHGNDVVGRAVRCLRGFIPRDVRQQLVGPPNDSVDTHIHDENWITSGSPLVRWNDDYRTWEYPAIRSKSNALRRQNATFALTLHQSLGAGRVTGDARHFTPFQTLACQRSKWSEFKYTLFKRVLEVHDRAPLEVNVREDTTNTFGYGRE